MSTDKTPLLLLDNNTMYVLSEGTYKVSPISFYDAKAMIDMFDTGNLLKCYTDRVIDQVIHDFMGVEQRDIPYKKIRKMRQGQMAIVIKQYVTDSETQPIIEPDPGVEAKKIQNVYVYCEFIVRLD